VNAWLRIPELLEGAELKSLMHLWQEVLTDVGAWCHVSTARDLQYFLARTKNEGEAFLTTSLPVYGKDFERSLDQGRILDDGWVGWKRVKTDSVVERLGRPLFLGGFLDLVFSADTGRLLEEPDVDAIFAIRQLTLMCAKLSELPSERLVRKAVDGYIECEKEVRAWEAQVPSSLLEEFRKASLILWGGVMQEVDEDVYHERVTPNHGPGATADSLHGNQKFQQIEWPNRLDEVFPFGKYIVTNERYHFVVLSGVRFLEPGEERPVKVTPVPKTATAARIISIEPTCMQYVQQGLMEKFVSYSESRLINGDHRKVNHGYGLIGFTDQVPNQYLARVGSEDQSLATLDLSEASDRVSNLLVETMTATFPNLRRGLQASRSTHADVPGHGVIRLAKFASMGSAVTFPVEAMVFSTLVMMGIADSLNRQVSPALVRELEDQVRVYGDDIIVPTDSVECVIDRLETFGFKVNLRKSFWTGKFRESCGREYYDGASVSIAKVRRRFPCSRKDVEEILSTVSLRNQLYMLGLWRATRFLDDILEECLNGFYPLVTEESPVLGRLSALGYEYSRMHPGLHAPLVRGYVVSARPPANAIDDHSALLKCLLKQGSEPFADSRHLQRSGRPRAVSIKLGWRSPF
jgi:hypothetical protein